MKKTLKALLIIVIVVALIIGSVAGVSYYKKGSQTVDVLSVSMLNLGYYEDSTTSEGVVKNNASQSVYITDGQKVVDVYVTEGQEVSEGDPIMAYDITSLELSVAMKKLQIEGYQNEYDTAVAKLTVLKNTVPIPDTVAAPSPVKTSAKASNVDGSSPKGTNGTEAADIISLDQKLSGQGSAEDPYVFVCGVNSMISGTVLNALKESGAVAKFEAVDGAGNIAMSVVMNGSYIADTYTDTDMIFIFSGNHSDSNIGVDNDDFGGNDLGTSDDSANLGAGNGSDLGGQEQSGYTAKELAAAIASQERSIRSIDIKKRTAENQLIDLESQLKDGVVYSKVNGVVKTVHELDDIPQDGSPFIVISGSEGLYIEGSVSELMLDTIQIGQRVSAYSWETGEYFEGEISEIDTVPTTNNSYYGDGNPNVSYYGYTAYIEDPSGLMAGQYLQLTIESADTGNADKLFIDQSYVRDEHGKSFVYKDDGGKLTKQYVDTGSILWGSYIEIKSGLTVDDYIAFPYGKNVKDGVKTVVSENMN